MNLNCTGAADCDAPVHVHGCYSAANLPPPQPVPYLGTPLGLDILLTLLARQGGWITAWYPLSNGEFECRISFGDGAIANAWAVKPTALAALYEAMSKAEVLTAHG